MTDEIIIRLDRETAETHYTALYESGEHLAAGAPLSRPGPEESARLGALLRDLDHALGRRCSPYCDHLTPSSAAVPAPSDGETRRARSTWRKPARPSQSPP